jgi:lipoate-protein ligase A
MAMRFLSLTLPTPAANLALDEALLLRAEAGEAGEVLRCWEQPSLAVVLGAGCRLADDVDEAACRADAVPILRRSSGGGAVLLGAGCLLYTLVLDGERAPELAGIRSSYAYILAKVAAALPEVNGVEPAGISDLAEAGRKFSGNAQQRKRRFLLHHGTLLYAFDLSRVGRYLRPPARQPEYRASRDHAAFLRNLETPADEIERRLRAAWDAEMIESEWPVERVRQLVAEKYTTEEWLRRR